MAMPSPISGPLTRTEPFCNQTSNAWPSPDHCTSKIVPVTCTT
jgi:hypothetical protein